MKITFILPGYGRKPLGGYRVVYEYANHLVEKSHQVSVVHSYSLKYLDLTSSFQQWLRKKTRYIANLPIRHNIWWQPIDKRVNMLYVPEPIDRYIPDADAVFATAWQTAEYVADYPASKGMKCYLVQDFGNYFGPERKLTATWKLPFKKITISNWLYEKVESVAGNNDLISIPIGIDFKRFRKKQEINDRPNRITMIYSSKRYKCSEDGIRAIEICKSKFPHLQVTLIGQGSRPVQIHSWIDFRYNISELELIQIYNKTKIFLCSSLAEGFAFPPAEAMACGCAVVSTDCGGNREYAKNGITALISPPKDPEALAKNVIKLLEDDLLREKIAKASYEKIQEFTWERSTNLIEKLLTNSLYDKNKHK